MEEADGWRYQLFATNTPTGQLAFLEARHRAHARVEDRIRCGKDTGIEHLPSKSYEINQAWCLAAMMACDLLCWLRLLCLHGPLALAEPKTLRYRLLHTAARLVRGQRKRKVKIPETWPWAHELETCFLTAFALVHPEPQSAPTVPPLPSRTPPARGTSTHRRDRRQPIHIHPMKARSEMEVKIISVCSGAKPIHTMNDQGQPSAPRLPRSRTW